MFNKDYEVYRDAVDENNRWLFINREGKGFFDPTGFIDLENYTRIDPENKKKGQVLWKLKYNEKPHFAMGATLDDSDSEGEFDAGMLSQLARVLMNTGNTRFYRMKWKMFNEAKMRRVRGEDQSQGFLHASNQHHVHSGRTRQPATTRVLR
jgi:hypothetical protein